jgi:multimeric flavodoxin WrbA
MRITVLNGNPDPDNDAFDHYLGDLADSLMSEDHRVTVLSLREMDLKYCKGCWGCWVRTPGECLAADDSQEILRESINSDLVVFASPVIMGFTSALLKQATDKFIPLVHPYIEIVHGECHHLARYDKYPVMGVLLEKGGDTDDEDLEIITDIYRRMAINFKTTLAFVKLTLDPVEEVVSEIDSV